MDENKITKSHKNSWIDKDDPVQKLTSLILFQIQFQIMVHLLYYFSVPFLCMLVICIRLVLLTVIEYIKMLLKFSTTL